MKYVQVILPLRLDWLPWYGVPDDGGVRRGSRVHVTFAHRRYVGVVSKVADSPDIPVERVMAVDALCDLPDITEEELRLWEFTSSYYMCSVGEVYKAAYPYSKTRSEESAADAKRRHEATVRKMRDSLRLRIARLEAQKSDTEARRKALDAARTALESLSEGPDGRGAGTVEVHGRPSKPALVIAPSRERYKTYMERIDSVVAEGLSALVLVPEIALAGAMEQAFRDRYGNALKVHHSLKTAAQRRKVAEDLRDVSGPEVILGTRTSVFLPYSCLGLVIIDEEQDPLYKQNEPAPRYNARDLAVVLAGIHGASALLGSACPSLESAFNVMSGRYVQGMNLPFRSPLTIIDIPAERHKRGMPGRLSIKAAEALRSAGGSAVVIRGWEPESDLRAEVDALGCGAEVLTVPQARITGRRWSLAVFVQADALFPNEGFRSDEMAVQSVVRISQIADRVIVQTAKAGHPVYTALSEGRDIFPELLSERKAFGLPPYSRTVMVTDSCTARLGSVKRLLAGAMEFDCPSPSSILVRIPRDSSSSASRERLARTIDAVEREYNRQGHPVVDADPL